MSCSLFGRVLVAAALLCLSLGCRTISTAVQTTGKAAGATAEVAGRAAGTAAKGAGEIIGETVEQADREMRGK